LEKNPFAVQGATKGEHRQDRQGRDYKGLQGQAGKDGQGRNLLGAELQI